MATSFPGEDAQPATRRDLANTQAAIEASTRASLAELRTEMTQGFREGDQKIAELRVDTTKGFREVDQKIAGLDQKISGLRVEIAEDSAKVDKRLTHQTRFLVGIMVVMNGALLGAILGTR